MSQYSAAVRWVRGEQPFVDQRYSRAHSWEFDGGARVAASVSPQVVPAPLSVEENVDPEEAFIAALASCHLLFFLSFAARRGFVIDAYSDEAVGVMAKNTAGRWAITKVTLRPVTAFSGDRRPSPEEIAAMHHQAHEHCFIANSVTTEVEILLD